MILCLLGQPLLFGNTRPALVVPANPVPAFPQASITPTGIGECVPDPVLAYPPAGSIRTGDALLRWSSATPLGPGEEFVVLAARTPSDLTGPNAQAEIVGTTTDTNLALDFAKWKYAGKSGSFYWIVRIQAADGTFLDCGNGKPLSFTVVGAIQPTRPPKEGTPGQPAPFCPPNQVCP